MTPCDYRLPDGTVPVLVSSDAPEMLPREAAALLGYLADHPETTPRAIAEMLFRTRTPRRHRALVMVSTRDELTEGLRAVVDGAEHSSVLRTGTPAGTRRVGYVFPGQGGQRPGMGRVFYDSALAFRDEADRCAAAFVALGAPSPLDYLLGEGVCDDTAAVVQPALFTQMAGLAALWRSAGVAPGVTVGHSQGEVAAAYVAGLISLADAVRVVSVRAHAADRLASADSDWAMAVVAAGREDCEDLLARHPGWAQLSVVNSAHLCGISGERATVGAIVDTLTERGTFARIIGVRYPAHTSVINGLRETVAAGLDNTVSPVFPDSDIPCVGATLGGPIPTDLPVDRYWFLNLRNPVRFDKAISGARDLGVDTFVELSEHPTLQLAITENLAASDGDHLVLGTSERTATGLHEFTRNLARLAVFDLDYRWDQLAGDDRPAGPPLADFPNTVMNEVKLWLPYDEVLPTRRTPDASAAPTAPAGSATSAAPVASPRLLVEDWVRLTHRDMVPPRAIGIINHTGACAELAAALCDAAPAAGATARVIDPTAAPTGLDSYVVLVPPGAQPDVLAAAADVAAFFGDPGWRPVLTEQINACWLVTVGAEAVVPGDPAPDLASAAVSAGFRSAGAQFRNTGFAHLDLAATASPAQAAPAVLAALHTAGESELALRDGGLYAKRLVEDDSRPAPAATAPAHVLIVGGTGTLGLDFCEYFAGRGARRITLVCRSGETPAVAARLQRIRAAGGAQIRVARCDIGDPAAIAQLAEDCATAPADLILHAAVHYSGIELDDITPEQVDQALAPKAVGITRVLDAVPRTNDCRVLLCSSVSATVGGRGMIVYAAANRMLDALAHRLRAAGLACSSVQWGQWTAPDLDASGWARLAATGLLQMRPVDAIELAMARFDRNAMVAAFDLPRARGVLETCGRASLLAQLTTATTATTATAAAAPPTTETTIQARVVNLLASTIGADGAEQIDTSLPMVAIGLDSMQALEFRRHIKAEFGHDLQIADLLGGATIADVLTRLNA